MLFVFYFSILTQTFEKSDVIGNNGFDMRSQHKKAILSMNLRYWILKKSFKTAGQCYSEVVHVKPIYQLKIKNISPYYFGPSLFNLYMCQ